MAYYLRRFKKTNECDGAGCDAPMPTTPDGMGDAIPCVSGDRWDNVFGVGWNLANTPKKKKYHARKRRKK